MYFLFSCSKQELNRTIYYPVSSSNYSSFISEQKVHRYINNELMLTKSNNTDYHIDAYTNDSGDTLMYVINFGYEKGWKIISADDRTPVILAESPKGYFSLDDNNPGISTWLYI